jgi:hypothetical protein
VDKFQLTGRKLVRVFNFRNGRVHVAHLLCYGVKQPNLKLKTQPKQLLGSLPLDISLLDYNQQKGKNNSSQFSSFFLAIFCQWQGGFKP